MKVHIRQYEPSDQKSIEQLIELKHNEVDLIPLLYRSNLTSAFVAVDDDKVIGIGLTWTSVTHQFCNYFRMIIDPNYQNAVANKLFSTITSTINNNLPLQTTLWETDVSLIDFYEKSRFQFIRKTFMPELQITQNLLTWNQSRQNKELQNNMVSLTTIVRDQNMMLEFCALVKSNYDQTHLDNPIAQLSLQKWKDMILADDLLMDGSYLLLDEQQKIVAYSLLHESDQEKRIEVGWCGSSNAQWQKSIPSLVQAQIRFAAKHGYTSLLGEFDTTSPFAMEVLSSIPFSPCAAWVTYQK